MLEGLLLNLLAQAIWELGLSPIFKGSEDLRAGLGPGGNPPGRRVAKYEAIAQTAATRYGALHALPASESEFASFLESPAIKNLVRSLYVFSLESDEPRHVGKSREEFIALWRHSPLSSMGSDEAGRAFEVLLEASEEAISTAISEGVLSAHEARSNARHQIVVQRLDAISRQVHLLGEASDLDVSAADSFDQEFRREVHSRHAYITPPDFYSASRVEIDRLYVMPRLVRERERGSRPAEPVSVSDWLESFQNAVVLGDPGGGKSTLAAKLCHILAGSSAVPLNGTQRTPVMVTLREYSAVSKEQGLSIVGYIEHVAETRYQLDVPKGAVDYLLLSGRLVVIFDGLDELLETHHRQQIRDDVESFQRRYPDAPILVTSRSVGYEQAPLNEDVFEAASLAQFSDEQVAEYAHKWFSFDEELTVPDRKAKADAFIEESRTVPDLRVNPLMLALMCNFYRGQNYLPRHRPEVYEQCARMLFETWDRSRGIEQVLPIAEHIRPAMRFLAYWIYQDEDRQSGVPEDALVEKAVEFLLKYRFDDEHEARHAAQAFIDFCAGRAWVFTDTGTAFDGEPLFQFTHRTFLEYFTADHLVGVADSTQQLSDDLIDRIAAREWVVVAQVAYQLRSRGTLSAADELLDALITHARNRSAGARANVLLFATECLTFLVPSPPVVRRVSETVVEFILEVFSPGSELDEIPIASQLFPALLAANAETRRTVSDVVESQLLDSIMSEGPTALSAAEAIQALQSGAHFSPELMVDWKKVADQLRAETRDRSRVLAQEDSDLARCLVQNEELGIRELVKWHGTDSLFTGWTVPLERHGWYGPLAENILMYASGAQAEEVNELGVRMLEEVGEAVLPVSPPWSDLDSGIRFGFQSFFARIGMPAEAKLAPEGLRGLAVILAVKLEEQIAEGQREGAGPDRGRLVELIRGSESGYVKAMEPLLLCRLDAATDAAPVINAMKVSPETAELFENWSVNKLDLVVVNDKAGD